MKKSVFIIAFISFVSITKAQTAYITNRDNNNESVINIATNAFTATIAVGDCPLGISVNPDGNKVYIANEGTNTINVINSATNIDTVQ